MGQKTVFFGNPFAVETPKDNLKGKLFRWQADGVHITFSFSHPLRARIDYAGKNAGDSGIHMDIPYSSDFLRALADSLNEMADDIESGKNT